MKKAPSSPLAVAVGAVLAVAWACAAGLRSAEATIESTCAAAAAEDGRVDARFCALQFAAYHGAAEADLLGLARTAALIGVSLGDDAMYDVREGTIPPPPAVGARGKVAMDTCAKAYDGVGMAFAVAADEVSARRYGEAREKFGRVAALARRCDAAVEVAGASTPPELKRYGADCQQMAVIGDAITRLLK